MAVDVEVGSFALPTSTNATFDVTLANSGLTPKALILWTTGLRTSTGVNTGQARLSYGFTDGTNMWCTSASSLGGGAADSDTKRFSGENLLVVLHEVTGVPTWVGSIVSFSAGSFRLNITVSAGAAHVCYYMVIGGSDITNVKVGNVTSSGSTGDDAKTGVGFQPDFMHFAGVLQTSAEYNGISNHAIHCLGAVNAALDQWSYSFCDDDAAATMNSSCRSNTGTAIECASVSDGLGTRGTVSAFGSDGWTWNWTTATARQWGYLAIKGGSWNVGNTAMPGSVSTLTVSGLTGTPKMLFLGSPGRINGTGAQVTNRVQHCIGMATGASQDAALCYASHDGSANSDASTIQGDFAVLRHYDATSDTELNRFSSTAFAAGQFSIDQTIADGTNRRLLYFTAGDTVAGGRTTKNTRSWPLGVETGMGWRMPA